MKKRLLSAALAVTMLFGSAAALPEGVFSESTSITASAEVSTATSGKCGENVKWSLKNGVLTISGKGKMNTSEAPFCYNPNITSVVIKSGVTSIDNIAFEGCPFLTSVTIPKSITSIGKRAFYDCSSLKSVTIPNSVTSIGEGAFSGCSSLKSITIPSGVKKVDFFSRCTSLTSVTIPSSVTSIEASAFKECTSLTSVSIPSSVTSIGSSAFDDCKSLKSVTIPNSVKSIGIAAFADCYGLESITIPGSVTSISASMFTHCYNLKSVTLRKGVKSIGLYAFDSCKITRLTIPSSVTSIDDHAFWGCKTLKSIIIPKNVKTIGEKAFGYYFDYTTREEMKTKGFTVYGVKGSAAEKYAKDNKFKFVAITDVIRIEGANRYDTAALISEELYKKGSGKTVVIAAGLTFNDALVAVPLASAYNVPLLLATEKHITAQTEAELKRLKAKNVIVVSTNGAIGAKAKAEFKALKYKMTYIEGKTCFETAAKVAKALQDKTKKAPDTIFFATDSAFADALSASPIAAIKGAPIMYLKNTGSIDKATADYLKSIKGKVKNAYIIGGDGVISDAMMKNVANALGLTVNKTVVRVAGVNRYETCVAVNNKFKSVLTGDGICVAKGLDFPDALAGGVYAAATKQALFLADGKKLQDFQNSYLKSKNASKITVFGGIGAVPDELVKLIAQASV